jgi:hypothetical protein
MPENAEQSSTVEIAVDKYPSLKNFRCKKGHEWKSTVDGISFAFYPPWDEKVDRLEVTRVPIATSGPLCPYCICDALKSNFEGVEVGAEGNCYCQHPAQPPSKPPPDAGR